MTATTNSRTTKQAALAEVQVEINIYHKEILMIENDMLRATLREDREAANRLRGLLGAARTEYALWQKTQDWILAN